jgi:hypothetical protein
MKTLLNLDMMVVQPLAVMRPCRLSDGLMKGDDE